MKKSARRASKAVPRCEINEDDLDDTPLRDDSDTVYDPDSDDIYYRLNDWDGDD